MILGAGGPARHPAAANESHRRRFVLSGMAVEGGVLILAVLLSFVLGIPIGDYWTWSISGFVLGFFASLPIFVLFIVLMRSSISSFRRIRHFLTSVLMPMLRGSSVYEIAAISCLAGLGEELLFRGVIQIGVGVMLTPVHGLVVGAFLFAIAHAITWAYVVLAGLMGLYLGSLVVFTGNLLPAVATHAVYDFFALYYLLHVIDRKKFATS